jgi:zinc protease
MTVPRLNVDSLPGPERIARRAFPNGVVGLAYENFSSPSVVVHGWLWAGSVDEPPDRAGLASMTASLLTRGTEQRTFAQLNEEIESVGAALSFASTGHTTRFTVKCLVEDLPLLMEILSDCLFHPTFPDRYVERRRGEILTAIEQRQHNTEAMASLRFGEEMYRDHPYGRSQLGYAETIELITRDDIDTFYRAHFGAQGMAATIVGAVPAQAGLETLQDTLGEWQGAQPVRVPLEPVQPVDAPRRAFTPIPGKTQSDIVLGWIALTRRDPDFLPAYLANCVLGQFGMMGRLGQHVREEAGLAYYAYSSLEAGIGPGPWAVIAGVAPTDVDHAVEAMMEEVTRLRHEPVGADELADNVAYIIDSLPLRLEGNEGIAAQIASMELFQLGLDYLQRFPTLLGAVSAEQVRAVAERLADPQAFVLSVAGPEASQESPDA